MLWRLVKLLAVLAVLLGCALVAYAFVGPLIFPADFAPPLDEIRTPVTLDAT